MQLLLNHYLKFVPNNDAFSKVNILKLVSNLFLHHANQLVIAEEIYPIVRKIHENQNEKVIRLYVLPLLTPSSPNLCHL